MLHYEKNKLVLNVVRRTENQVCSKCSEISLEIEIITTKKIQFSAAKSIKRVPVAAAGSI
jgi:hypothetical protein